MGEWIYNSSFDTVMDFAVTVDNVFKRYGQVEALQGVSLSVRPGELFGIIGPDGAGKTSLFRILATLLLADEGKATVCGLDTEVKPGKKFWGERIMWKLQNFRNRQHLQCMMHLKQQ